MDKAELTQLRQSQAAQRELSITGASTPLLPRNDRRIAVVIGSDNAVDLWISLGKPAAVGKGILLASKQYPLTLSLDQYGAMVMGDMFAIASAGTALISVWETNLPL